MQKAVHASIDTSYAVLHHTISNTVCPQLLGAQNAYTLSVIDIQMRLLADLENQYWRKHFAHRPYYVAGRSYDQYQPAYELGWLHAVQHPLSSFDTLEAHLAQQWSSQRTTSLLSWKEARSAVQDGWRHALQQQHAWQQPAAPASSLTPEMARMLKSLYRHGLHLSGELTRLAQMRVVTLSPKSSISMHGCCVTFHAVWQSFRRTAYITVAQP